MPKEANWYFTFGYGQEHGPDHYVKFYGTCDSAREQMVEHYGQKWAFQYSEGHEFGKITYNMKELK